MEARRLRAASRIGAALILGVGACAILLGFPAAGFAADPAPEPPSAREVLDRYIETIGGADALRAHASRRITGTFALPAQGIEGEVLLMAAAPNYYLLQIDVPNIGRITSGFDGTVGWLNQPMSGPMLLEGEALEQIREDADFYELLKAEERFREMTNLGAETIEGKTVWKLRMVRPSGRTTYEYYDVETHLPVAMQGPQATPMGTIDVTTVVDAHREFGGVLFPAVLRQKLMGMEQIMRFETAEFDTVDPAVFMLPPEIKALVEAKKPKESEPTTPEKEEGGW